MSAGRDMFRVLAIAKACFGAPARYTSLSINTKETQMHIFGFRFLLPLLVLLDPVTCISANAQTPGQARIVQAPPKGVSGIIVAVAEDHVIVKQKDGKAIEVVMTPRWTISTLRTAPFSELAIGDFIGSASYDLGPEFGRANELRIFEPGYRPEYGTHAIATPSTSMTHGFVFGIKKRHDGHVIEVAYPEGRRLILVPDALPITVSDPLPRSAATPGQDVSLVMRPGVDGIYRASRLVIATPK